MRIRAFHAILLLLSSFLYNCSSQSADHSIMTYNIRHGVGMDRVLDLERTARVINAADPDILVLNEVDHGTQRSFGVHQADSLGARLNMYAIFGRSIDYDGGQYGNALLSKHPIIDFRIVDLSTDSLLEGRSVFLSHIDMEGDTITILGTHLGLSQEERELQVKRIIEILPAQEKFILAGDFNFEADSENYSEITSYLRDGLALSETPPSMTFPADNPDRRIDYIYVSEAVEMIDHDPFQHPEKTSASDHQPLILYFR